MIRSALLLCVALLAALSFACVAVTPVPTGVNAGMRQFTVSDCSDGGKPSPFLNKIYPLDASYLPGNAGYQAPAPPTGASPVGDPFQGALRDAYCMASTGFRKQLDELTGVFILCANPNMCAPSGLQNVASSWGYRENANNQSVLQHTYIALSADLWDSSTSQPMPYSNFEQLMFYNLLMSSGLNISYQAQDAGTNDSTTWTILAALAHELGHIYWWKLDIGNTDCGSPYGMFAGKSWNNADNPSQFHRFGVETPYSNGHGNASKHNADKDKVKHGSMVKQQYLDLFDIYGKGYWASLFSTVSPDEDFIETFKLWILTSNISTPMQHFYVKNTDMTYGSTWTTNPVDIVALMNQSGTELNRKIQWVSNPQCFAWPS
jgi:hypothetical protein